MFSHFSIAILGVWVFFLEHSHDYTATGVTLAEKVSASGHLVQEVEVSTAKLGISWTGLGYAIRIEEEGTIPSSRS